MSLGFANDSPGLLVSVRSASEAHEALAGGADVIDVKEPERGPLGAADAETIAGVLRAVDGRAPVTAAMGELLEISPTPGASVQPIDSQHVTLFKIGLAGCGRTGNWRELWRDAIERLSETGPTHAAKPVAVVYADWHTARAPEPEQVLQAATELGCSALLIDTWDKSSGLLFDHWPVNPLRSFMARVREHDLAVVIAGSLAGESFRTAVGLRPDLVAVRSAACDTGRSGNVRRLRVQALKSVIAQGVSGKPLPVSTIL